MTEIEAKVAELEKTVGSFAKEMSEFRHVHVSRRGLPGIQGQRGEASTIAGPPGRVAKITIGSVTQGKEAAATIVDNGDGVHVLSLVLARGLPGERGADGVSNVPGPAGKDGATIVGPQGIPGIGISGPVGATGATGRPGADGVSNIPGPPGADGRSASIVVGSVQSGDEAKVSIEEEGDGVFALHFILPRGLTGERGADGVGKEGIRGRDGKPGDISVAVAQAEREARTVAKETVLETLKELGLMT